MARSGRRPSSMPSRRATRLFAMTTPCVGTPYAFHPPGRALVAASRSRPLHVARPGLSPDEKRGHMSSKNLDIGSLTFHRLGPPAASHHPPTWRPSPFTVHGSRFTVQRFNDSTVRRFSHSSRRNQTKADSELFRAIPSYSDFKIPISPFSILLFSLL